MSKRYKYTIQKDWFVYFNRKLSSGDVFYVGITTQPQKRPNERLSRSWAWKAEADSGFYSTIEYRGLSIIQAQMREALCIEERFDTIVNIKIGF